MHLIHKSLIFAFISLMLFIPFSTNDTFAQIEELIVITTDQSSYQEGDTIIISGEVSDRLDNTPISLAVYAPDGLTIASAIVYIDFYNKFQREITAGGIMIDEGTYTIRVQVYIDSAVRTAETTFEFQSSQQPDCGPNQVFQLGVCQDTFAQIEELIVITTDQSSYQEGDTIVISGEVRDRLDNTPISITVFSPDGLTIASAIVYIDSYNKFQREITAGGTMIDEGTYTIRVQVYIDSAVRTAETTFEFQSSQQPDCGPNQVFQLGVCQDTFAQIEELIVITTDQSSYQEGDTIVISGEVRDRLYNSPISITVFSPDGLTIASAIVYIDSYNKFQREITAGGTMKDEGTYTIRVQVYIDSVVRTAETTFYFQSQISSDCGPNQVFQLGVCQDIMSDVNVDLEIYPVPFDKTANDMVTLEFTAKSDALKGTMTGAIDHLDYKVIITKDGNEIWSQQFHDHDGNLELKITPSEGKFTTTGGQEVGTSETKAYMISGPVFMDNGNYQVTAQIVGIEFNPLPTPLIDDFNMQVDGGKPLFTSITVSIDKLTYDFSSTIFVNGKVTNPKSETFVSLLVKNPTNQIVTVDQLSIDTYGNFNTRLSTTGNNWAEDGTHTIRVQYGNQVYDETTIKLFGRTAVIPITVSTDKTSYNYGETIIISGQVSERLDNTPIGLTVIFPDGRIVTETLDVDYHNKFQVYLSTASTLWKLPGTYTITAQQGTQKHTTSFYLEGSRQPSPSIGIIDTVPPLLLTPSDMTIDASDSSGARVDYSVIVIDDEDGVLRPSCFPFSGGLFSIGETTVSCSAIDYSGNSDKKSFVITVNAPDVLIPSWIKDVAGFWCGDKIGDASFIEAIQYLINNDVIVVPATTSSGSGSQEIPNWIKNNACWWSQGLITNNDFASGLQYLGGQGIIRV